VSELRCCDRENSNVAGKLVRRCGGPVEGLRSRFGIRKSLRQFAVASLRLSPQPPRKGGVSHSQVKLNEKIVRRQITLDAMTFDPSGIHHHQSGSEMHAKPLKESRLFVYVYSYRLELAAHVRRNAFVRKYLGIQPGASRSCRSRGEVQ